MPTPSSPSGAPRARVDPIDTAARALAVIELARSWPPRDEIIAFLVDAGYRGNGVILELTGVRGASDVLAVVEMLGESVARRVEAGDVAGDAGNGLPTAMVVASARLRESSLLDDIDLWEQASDLADSFGITLLEWFVLTPSGAWCPRDALGEPDRWPR